MTMSLNLAFGVDRKAGAGYSGAICVQARWVDTLMTNTEDVSIAQPLDAYGRPLRSLRVSVTESLQSPLPVLHAGGGVRLA